MTGRHASVHFENGQNTKNAHENEKNMTGRHASVHFENEQNTKNAHKNEKKYDRTTSLRSFRK